MEKSTAAIRPVMQPAPKAIVSSRNKKGENNALVVAYCCNCSYDPPMAMVGIVPSRYSYDMIKESGVFVVNLPAKRNKALYDYVGSHSRRDGDKLAEIGATLREGEKVPAPVLADCPIHIECEVVDSIRTGSHEMFVGKIVSVHADKELVQEDGSIDFSAADLL
ncbi:MAG: flavin reductase family protein [Clostridiaceae bacterium]|jgi:flavin reductase (DIM6/NTAB) family NADH-FMN oxidoreductase RutF|nr:flavin reductase family protein [Clostridiaceae bacterium]